MQFVLAQILLIFFPVGGIGENVIHKRLMFPIIADNTLIIISLPEAVIKTRPIILVYTINISSGCL